jgi:hypothetical protein
MRQSMLPVVLPVQVGGHSRPQKETGASLDHFSRSIIPTEEIIGERCSHLSRSRADYDVTTLCHERCGETFDYLACP